MLLEATPRGLDLDQVRRHLLCRRHVRAVHDLHASQIATSLPVLTAHVVVDDSCFHDGHAPRARPAADLPGRPLPGRRRALHLPARAAQPRRPRAPDPPLTGCVRSGRHPPLSRRPRRRRPRRARRTTWSARTRPARSRWPRTSPAAATSTWPWSAPVRWTTTASRALVARLRHEALPCPARGLELVAYRRDVAALRHPGAGLRGGAERRGRGCPSWPPTTRRTGRPRDGRFWYGAGPQHPAPERPRPARPARAAGLRRPDAGRPAPAVGRRPSHWWMAVPTPAGDEPAPRRAEDAVLGACRSLSPGPGRRLAVQGRRRRAARRRRRPGYPLLTQALVARRGGTPARAARRPGPSRPGSAPRSPAVRSRGDGAAASRARLGRAGPGIRGPASQDTETTPFGVPSPVGPS